MREGMTSSRAASADSGAARRYLRLSWFVYGVFTGVA